MEFQEEGINEIAKVKKIQGETAHSLKVGDVVVRVDPKYFRPTEVESLLGDASKAKTKLNWVPEISLKEMCKEMVANDLNQARQQIILNKNGYPT